MVHFDINRHAFSTHINILNFSNKPSNDISRKNGDDLVSEVNHAKGEFNIEDLT